MSTTIDIPISSLDGPKIQEWRAEYQQYKSLHRQLGVSEEDYIRSHLDPPVDVDFLELHYEAARKRYPQFFRGIG